jgi:hypothetical protein
MNSHHVIELGIRATRCKRFEWIPGFLVMSNPERVPRVIGAPIWSSDLRARVTCAVIGRWFGVAQYCVDYPDAEHETMSSDDLPGTIPDLSDPGSIGCLLALVRKAWDDERISVAFAKAEGRFVIVDSLCSAMLADGRYFYGDTEAEALIAALEAAP